MCIKGYAESGLETENDVPYQEYLLKEAELPRIPPYPDMSDPGSSDDEKMAQFAEWREAKAEQERIVIPDLEQIQQFMRESTREFAADCEKSNFLYSPVSLWFCLHTLSDLTEGNSQAQIQRVIGRQTEKDEDAQLDSVFRSLFWEDEGSVCTPAISVWLDRSASMSETLLEQLTTKAHSSVFQGTMGEEAFDEALQLWLNKQTRGLLKESVSDLRFSSDAGLSVCSTLYMKNGWSIPFSKYETAPDVFYAETGEVTTDFMHSSDANAVYSGDGFTAAVLHFQDGGNVAFILPDPGVSPEEILNGDDVFRFLFSGRDRDDGLYGRVNLSVPKMDFLTDISMKSALEKMGIIDVFDPQKAQFSAELSSDSELSVSNIQQYARLILNEDGVEAAAITLTIDGGLFIPAEDEKDFTLNRPFLFAVMSERDMPLFIGIYRMP